MNDDYRTLLHDEQAEGDRLWAQGEKWRCERDEARRQLAISNKAVVELANLLLKTGNDLAEARKIVWLLIAFARAHVCCDLNYCVTLEALPRWLMRRIEP